MLPLWVQALQALAVPVIAAVGAWVAVQQMVIELQCQCIKFRSVIPGLAGHDRR